MRDSALRKFGEHLLIKKPGTFVPGFTIKDMIQFGGVRGVPGANSEHHSEPHSEQIPNGAKPTSHFTSKS